MARGLCEHLSKRCPVLRLVQDLKCKGVFRLNENFGDRLINANTYQNAAMYMNRWCSALESHQSGGGIACINDRAFEGVCARPHKVVGKYYKIGKNKKVYVVIKPIIIISLCFRTYKETTV